MQRLNRVLSLNGRDQATERSKPLEQVLQAPMQVAPQPPRPAPRNRELSAGANSDTVSLDRASASHTPRPSRPKMAKYAGDDFIENPAGDLVQPEQGYVQPIPSHPAPRPAPMKVKPLKQWDRSIKMGQRGYDSDMLRKCTDMLTSLMRHKMAWPFNEPVNATALGLVDYHDIIRKPMDMGTIRSRTYTSTDDFAEDMRLVFDNAMKYNPPTSDVHQMALTVLDAFEKKWSKLIETSKKPPQQPKPRGQTIYKDDLLGYDDELPLPGQKRGRSYRKTETAEERKVRDLEAKLQAMEQQQKMLLQRVNSGGVSGNFADPETDSVGGGGTLAADRQLKSFIDPHRAMSLEQKRELSFNFKKLPDDKLLLAVDIIRDNMPVDNDADDIVIDIDSLDNKTLWELKEFIDQAMPRKGGARRKSGGSGTGHEQSHQGGKSSQKNDKSGKGDESNSDSSSSSSSSDSDSDSDDNSSAASDADKQTSLPVKAATSAAAPANTTAAVPMQNRPQASAQTAAAPPPSAAPSSSPAPAAGGGWTAPSAAAAVEKKPLSFSFGGGAASSKGVGIGTKKPVELKNTSSWLNLMNKDSTTVGAASGSGGGNTNALWDEHRNKAQQAKERDQQRNEVAEQQRAEEQRAAQERRRQEEEEANRQRELEESRQREEESQRESEELKRKNAREAERAAREEAVKEGADDARFETEAGLDDDDDFGLDSMGYGSAMGM